MLPLTYPTECSTSTVVRPLTDAERLTELRRDLDADLHYAWWRSATCAGPMANRSWSPKRCMRPRSAPTPSEAAFSLVVRAAALGESAVSVGTLFVEWTKLARARLLDTLVEPTEDGQRVTFGSRQ